MIAILTRRFILISLIFVMIAGAVASAISRQDAPSRAWVAGQTVPCVTDEGDNCTIPRNR